MPGMRVTCSVRFTPHGIEDILRRNKRTAGGGSGLDNVKTINLSKTENIVIRDTALNTEHVNTDQDTISRRRKMRTTFTGRQIFEMEKMFETKKYLNRSERSNLSR